MEETRPTIPEEMSQLSNAVVAAMTHWGVHPRANPIPGCHDCQEVLLKIILHSAGVLNMIIPSNEGEAH